MHLVQFVPMAPRFYGLDPSERALASRYAELLCRRAAACFPEVDFVPQSGLDEPLEGDRMSPVLTARIRDFLDACLPDLVRDVPLLLLLEDLAWDFDLPMELGPVLPDELPDADIEA